jgi:hypothetical protein
VLEAADLPVLFDGLLLDALGPCPSPGSRARPATEDADDAGSTAGRMGREGTG